MTTGDKKLTLGIVARSQYAGLKEGVDINGLDLECVEVAPMPRLFDRMIKDLEFDVSEMAIVTYLQLKELGQAFTAIPVFPLRAFPHGAILHNVNSGIKAPGDVAGRKIGVRAYAGTAGVWARGLLQSEYGVEPSSVSWVLNDNEHLDDMPNPSNTELIKGAKLADMLIAGEIDAGIGLQGVDSPDVKPLIGNAREAQTAWFKKTGVFPINNTIVVRDSVLAYNPRIAVGLYDAYKASKSAYLAQLKEKGADGRDQEADVRFMEIVGDDPLPVGVEANRKALELIIEYSLAQGVISKSLNVDELFAANTVALA
jgi:4,5-dihydroxyphthalate decarboxylase